MEMKISKDKHSIVTIAIFKMQSIACLPERIELPFFFGLWPKNGCNKSLQSFQSNKSERSVTVLIIPKDFTFQPLDDATAILNSMMMILVRYFYQSLIYVYFSTLCFFLKTIC